MFRLEPLDKAPAMNEHAKQLIQRFERRYAMEPFTRMQGAISVTSLAKDKSGEQGAAMQRKLDLPVFFQTEAAPKATDVGNATHTVLQYFDFSSGEVEAQIQGLVDRKLLAAREAKWVDREAIKWLLGTPLGNVLRANHSKLIRETPFALMRPPPIVRRALILSTK